MIKFIEDAWNNIFGKGSEKSYFKNRTVRIGTKGAVYIDTDVPYKLVNSIPQLKLSVNKLESMFANMSIKYQKIGESGYIDMPQDLQKLLENPNPIQSQNEFLKQYIGQLIVYGNQFIYKNKPSRIGVYPTTLMNVSAANMKPILTGKIFDQVSMSDIIKEYEYSENSTTKTFETKDVIWSKIGDLDNPLVGCSPLKSLQYPLTNTKLAYDYLNVISAENGGIGMISTINKDNAGVLPMTQEEKKEIEREFQNSYGLGESADGSNKMRMHIVAGNTTYTPMSYPTGQLLLLEQVEANFIVIALAVGLNQNIFGSTTYENLKHGLIQAYNDTIFPYADGFTQTLSRNIGVPEGYRLVADYSHISVLQADETEEAQTFKTVSESLNQLTTAGIISVQDAKKILDNKFKLDIAGAA